MCVLPVLSVVAPVTSVTLLIGDDTDPQHNSSSGFQMTSSHHGDVVTPGNPRVSAPLTENQPSKVRCVALGGYPPPRVEVTVDPRREVTAQMVLRHGVNMATTSGKAGLRRLVRRTELSTFNYVSTGSDDGRWAHCIATVAGRRPFVDSVQLNVHCKCRTMSLVVAVVVLAPAAGPVAEAAAMSHLLTDDKRT